MPRSTTDAARRRDDPSERPEPGAVDLLTGRRLARLETEVVGPALRVREAEARLRLLVSAYTVLALDDPQTMALFTEIGSEDVGVPRPAAVRERIDRFIDLLESDLTEILDQRRRSSRIHPKVAALSLLGIIHWGIRSHRAEQRLSRDQAIEQVTFLALHGLTAEPEGRRA